MGDTARSDITASSDVIQIQFPTKEDYLTESEDETPREPPPKLSDATLNKNSSNTDTVTTEVPPFLIPTYSTPSTQSAQSTPRRRHNRQTLFDEPKPGQEIFSVNGKRGINLPRHQDNVTCFPSGCMGIKDGEESVEVSPRIEEPSVSAKHSVLTQEEQKEILQKPETAPKKDLHLHTIARNPLTGEGYEDKDFVNHSMFRKIDGNPVLGHGYVERKRSKQSKVPPGGYSQGLW